MVRLILVTLALAAVAVAVRMRTGSSTKADRLRVTARTALNRGAVIAIVEVEGRRLLIGAGGQQISLLTELEPVQDPAPRARAERPSELPVVPDNEDNLIERFRRATTRSLDPTRRERVPSTIDTPASDWPG